MVAFIRVCKIFTMRSPITNYEHVSVCLNAFQYMNMYVISI